MKFSVPVTFTADKDTIFSDTLEKASYGFVFQIRDKIYMLTEAKALLGASFPSKKVDIALPYDDKQKYPMPGKIDVYLVKIKS